MLRDAPAVGIMLEMRLECGYGNARKTPFEPTTHRMRLCQAPESDVGRMTTQLARRKM